jgi:hypothetical protein
MEFLDTRLADPLRRGYDHIVYCISLMFNAVLDKYLANIIE